MDLLCGKAFLCTAALYVGLYRVVGFEKGVVYIGRYIYVEFSPPLFLGLQELDLSQEGRGRGFSLLMPPAPSSRSVPVPLRSGRSRFFEYPVLREAVAGELSCCTVLLCQLKYRTAIIRTLLIIFFPFSLTRSDWSRPLGGISAGQPATATGPAAGSKGSH